MTSKTHRVHDDSVASGDTVRNDAAPAAPAAAAPPAAAPAGSTTIIGILLVSAFVVILNETIMNVALARIMDELGISESTAQWLTTGFLLTMAVVIPITGWLIGRLPTRTIYLMAMGLFSLGTLIAAASPSFAPLLVGRIVQACGTAIMMPLLMTTIMTLVPPASRGRVMGNVSIVIAVAPAIGPTVSGLILSVAHWRFLFIAVLPIALAVLVLGAWRMRDVGERRTTKLDVLSIVLSAIGFGGLVYGLSGFGSAGTSPIVAWGSIAVAIVTLVLFGWRQTVLQRTDAAFLDLRTFRYTSFSIALGIMAVAMMGMFGVVIVLPLILQHAFGLEPLDVGLMLLPGGLAMGLLGPVVGRLYDRFGPRVLVVPGSMVVASVFVLLAFVTLDTPVWFIILAHVLLSVGLAFMFTPLFTVALGSLPPQLYSHGSALVGTLQQVSGAAGTAGFIAVMVIGSAAGEQAGLGPAEAMMSGAHAAFIAAGALWVLPLVAAWFTRRPPAEPAQLTN